MNRPASLSAALSCERSSSPTSSISVTTSLIVNIDISFAGIDELMSAAEGEGELQMRIKKLESVVKRQRSVVREQKDSIAVLIASVDELQRSLACKDTEIARLRGKCGAPSHKESADGDTENIGGLQQELRAQRDETRRVHEQLAASRERERALEAHVAQLQRKHPSPVSILLCP